MCIQGSKSLIAQSSRAQPLSPARGAKGADEHSAAAAETTIPVSAPLTSVPAIQQTNEPGLFALVRARGASLSGRGQWTCTSRRPANLAASRPSRETHGHAKLPITPCAPLHSCARSLRGLLPAYTLSSVFLGPCIIQANTARARGSLPKSLDCGRIQGLDRKNLSTSVLFCETRGCRDVRRADRSSFEDRSRRARGSRVQGKSTVEDFALRLRQLS